MLRLYEKYLEVVDAYLIECFNSQLPFIKCASGCAACCEIGEYPLSRLEMEYLMEGFVLLPVEVQNKIRLEIRKLLQQKNCFSGRWLHRCPFLSDEKTCYLYSRRGIICRAYGLASFEMKNGKKIVKLPECSHFGLNYSEVFDGKEVDLRKFKKYGVKSLIKHSLNLSYFEKDLLKGFNKIEFGEIRPMLGWFEIY